MPPGDGEADPPGAGPCRRSDGPMRGGPSHAHEPREHAGHGMRPFKALISFEDAKRMAMDLVRPMERMETVAILEASGRVAADFFSSRRRHTILQGDWSSDVCSSD